MKVSIGAKAVFSVYPSSPQSVSGTKKGQGETLAKRDTIMISQEARQRFGQMQQNKSSMLENFMKQREKIQEMKSNLTERTLENGDDLSIIKDQLAEFDKQMAEIDEQIFAYEAQKRQQAQREEEEKLAAAQPKPTGEAAQMTSLLQSTQSLKHVEALERVKGTIERDHRRLKTEMKNDASRGTFIDSKQEKLGNLERRMRNLDNAMHEQIGEANKAVDDTSVRQLDEEKEEEE